MAASGFAFIFLLPYEIHTRAGWRTPVVGKLAGRRIAVYPPFRNGEGLKLSRHLDLASIPYRPGTAPPATRLPELKVAGAPGWQSEFVLADGLRIDIQGLGQGDSAIAEDIGTRVLRSIRLVTRQWWILRGASESLTPLQNAFPVDSIGTPVGGTLHRTQHVVPWLGTEQLITESLLSLAIRGLETEADVPFSASTILDSIFAATHQDRGQATLLAAIACEVLFAEETFAAIQRGEVPRSAARKAMKIRDLRERVDEGANSVFGRSFAAERPNDAAALGLLWVARHALAHGSRSQQERNAVLNDQATFRVASSGAFAFFEWMASLRPRSVPDFLAFFTQPLVAPTG